MNDGVWLYDHKQTCSANQEAHPISRAIHLGNPKSPTAKESIESLKPWIKDGLESVNGC
jgi:hypothetical protein